MSTDPVYKRSLDEVALAASHANSARALDREVREIGSRRGPCEAARVFGRYRERFASTKRSTRLLGDLIGGIATIPLSDGSFMGRSRARRSIGWCLMTCPELVTYEREVSRREKLCLHRVTDSAHVSPWFATQAEACAAWQRRGVVLAETAIVETERIVAVKWTGAGLEYVVDPNPSVSVNWGAII